VSISETGGCSLDPAAVCVQIASRPIVANNVYDIRSAGWSDCLPQSRFQIVGNKMYLAAQYKSAYKVRIAKYISDRRPVYGCTAYLAGVCLSHGIIGYDDVPTSTPGSFNQTCYFDTRVQPISGTGANCSKALASVADNVNICDTNYPEARTLMNPRIAQILQPFHENDECQSFTCSNGRIVELCGCDATGKGVTLGSLDALNHATNYIDYSNTSADPVNGAAAYLSDCARGNVIFFDPPSGGSVTLDNPDGDSILLPPYPVTLVVRVADLRIKDNLIYPPNSNASLGVILLENKVCGATYGGGAFLHPDPTNVVGAYYLEGSLKSTDANWHLPTNRNSTQWYQTFKNQILWEGTIVSLNSIGGAVNPNWPGNDPSCLPSRRPYEIGGGFPDPAWSEAVEYDLAYLREYFRCGNLTSELSPYGSSNWKVSGCDNTAHPFSEIAYDELPKPESANGTTAPEAVVLRYDSRIQNNPPPGFDSLAHLLQAEIGR
jgi:hypothetical protein